MNFKRLSLATFIGAGLTLASCSSDDPTPTGDGTSTMNVRLTDAPCDYDEVNIDVQAVEVIYEDTGKVTLNSIAPGVYNLLDFNNGLDTLIAADNLPSGRVSQIRLILGQNNTIMIDSTVYNLTTPSAQQSGLKVKFNTELLDGFEYNVTLDFDACRSIVVTGSPSPKYILKPVIRAFVDATTGSISGWVQPDTAVSYTYVVNQNDTVGTIPDSTGFFQLSGLPSGAYDVEFTANAPYNNYTESQVQVTAGQVNNIDTIQF